MDVVPLSYARPPDVSAPTSHVPADSPPPAWASSSPYYIAGEEAAAGAQRAPAPEWGSSIALDAAAAIRAPPTDIGLMARRDRVMRRASDAGLLGLHSRPDDVFSMPPRLQELHDLRQLRAATQHIAHESVDPGRLQSALSHWELWRQELPSRVPILPLAGDGSPGVDVATRYNSETFELFTASCLRRGSLQPGHLGRPIETDTIAGYVSAIRALLSRDSGMQVRSASHDIRTKAVCRTVRRSRGPRGTRRRRIGLRAQTLRAAASNRHFDRRRTWSARRRWLAAVLAHSLIARGGEIGRVDNKAFDINRGLRWRDVEWHAVGTLHPTHAALTVHMCSVKDGDGVGERHPIQIYGGELPDGSGLRTPYVATTCCSRHGTTTSPFSGQKPHSMRLSFDRPHVGALPMPTPPRLCAT